MADTTIGAKLTVDATQATGSVKNFKAELRLAQEEVVALTAKFGATSKEVTAAAQKAAGLKDAIGDAKSLVDAFNPDTKFRAFGASINTVVGGFTALQGVMGLVGAESEETQKALLKVQSALAISQGLGQLQEGVQTFKNLGAVIQATTVFKKADNVVTAISTTLMRLFGVSAVTSAGSLKVLKTAIAATGIGLLVVGLAAAADALGLFSDKTEDAADAQDRLAKSISEVNEALTINQTAVSREEKLEVARAKNRGASEQEIFNIQQQFRVNNFNATKAAYEELAVLDKVAAGKLLASLKEQNIAGQVAQLEFDTKQNDQRLAKAKEFDEKLRKQNEEARRRQLQDAIDEQNRQSAIGLRNIDRISVEIPKTQVQIQIENEAKARRDARLEEEDLQRRAAESYAQFTIIHARNVQERIDNEQLEFDTKVALANASTSLLTAVGDLLGKETAAAKVLGIATATINTYIGATEVLRAKTILPEPAGTIAKFVNFAAVILTGLSAVKKIVSTPVPGGGGGSVASVSAPLLPQKAQTETTTLDQQSINAIGSATTRAYVLESDVSNNQEKVRRLNRAARIA